MFNNQAEQARFEIMHQVNLRQTSAEKRFAGYCMQYGIRRAELGLDETVLPMPMSRTDLASYLGMKLESLSRVISRLQSRGLIAARRHQVTFEEKSGWAFKPEGACKGDVCIPLSADVLAADNAETVELASITEALGLPMLVDENHGLYAVGPESIGARALVTADAPSLVLPDLDGQPFDLASLRGQKALREELHQQNFELVTVGLDTLGEQGCRAYIEAAAPQHPALIDQHHVLAEKFGVINIPSAIWIDEQGVIVRPAEAAPAPPQPETQQAPPPAGDAPAMPERFVEMMGEAVKIKSDAQAYHAALRDWVEHGAESRFALYHWVMPISNSPVLWNWPERMLRRYPTFVRRMN
ncbi:fnr [Symbiodinium necroappetens]|uniref:Fnr protein n=1 Tax=Symbiodinium necroappetens TaxID=1628268 RepID=A0A812ISH1_9DINO|nr:fnr [Symbiodinium necroappetens]